MKPKSLLKSCVHCTTLITYILHKNIKKIISLYLIEKKKLIDRFYLEHSFCRVSLNIISIYNNLNNSIPNLKVNKVYKIR